MRKYVEFVHAGARLPSVWTQLQGQIYLGSEGFVKQMQAQIEKNLRSTRYRAPSGAR